MYKRNIFCFALIILSTSLSPVYAGGNEEGESASISIKEQVLNNPDSVMKGDAKFHATCAYCHGAKGSGGKAKKLQGRQNLKADYIFKTITNGKKRGSLNMPPWRGLPEEVRWQLTAYILSLSEIKK
jgi:mono/diheme cytochrome c family protein